MLAELPLISKLQLSSLPAEWRPWIEAAAILAAAILAALVLHLFLLGLLGRLARRTPFDLDETLVARLRAPLRLLLPLLAAQLTLPLVRQRTGAELEGLGHALALLLVTGVAWQAIALLQAAREHIERTHRIDVPDNLEARRLRTQTTVLMRVCVGLVVLLAIGAGLMTFPRVRQVGTSLLASAGLVGLALGISARPVLENLIAGLQLALTQPVRLDDVVIVQGEWGRIEDITATYVVVKIWDERRLIVPFSKFISEPFQNWTRETAAILGTVFLHVDYTVPVEAVREELRRIVEDLEDWDGRVCNLQVTDTSERSLELRALVSSADASRGWNLRCRVREELIGYLQREYPDSLPRARVSLAGAEASRSAERSSLSAAASSPAGS